MRYRKLGNTGIMVSEIGFGTIPVTSGNVSVLPKYYSPDLDQAVKIMKRAYELGCNLYDTAVPEEYGDAERKLGVFAEQIPRKKIIISDKARFYDGNEIYNAVIQSSENLGTYPDIYFVHQVDNENQDRVFAKYGAIDALCDLKTEGKIRFTGIASHYYDVLLRGAHDKRVDILQGSGNIFERGMLERIADTGAFKEKGFILNKVLAAGLLTEHFTVDELIGGILHYPFSSALIGIGTYDQADAAMKDEKKSVCFSCDDVKNRIKRSFSPVMCIRCQKCICNYGFEIHTILRQYNYYHLGKEHWALKKLNLNIREVNEKCASCTSLQCELNCPMKIHIPETISRISEMVERMT